MKANGSRRSPGKFGLSISAYMDPRQRHSMGAGSRETLKRRSDEARVLESVSLHICLISFAKEMPGTRSSQWAALRDLRPMEASITSPQINPWGQSLDKFKEWDLKGRNCCCARA